MSDPKDILKALKINDPLKDIRESLKVMQMHDPMKEIRESLKVMQMHDPMKEIRESLKVMQMHDPMKEIRESLKVMQMHDPMKEIRESLKVFQMHDQMGGIRESIRILSDERWVLEIEDEPDIHVSESGDISLGTDSIALQELQVIAQEVISNVFSDSASRIEYKLDQLIEQISALKDPFLQKLLSWLIYPLIIGLVLSLVNPVSDFYVKKALTSNEKKIIVKEISAIVPRVAQETIYLSSFKIVSADMLNVRRSGTNKSTILGILYFGDVVEVVEKGRKWSLVKWHDSENDMTLKGWVFSRYLKKIR